MKTVAVIDIGKTNVKVALVDLLTSTETAVETSPNTVLPGPPWPHFDTDAQWTFIRDALRRLGRTTRIDAITTTTHGACAALLDAAGGLAAPVMDYEFSGPDDMRAAYDAIRPAFEETGSPGLPGGLNLGAQLHYMLMRDQGLLERTANVVMWPQYWGYRLTGRFASDVCSLGCHTDLWNPHASSWSSLADKLGLVGKLAPPRRPGEVLGTLIPELQDDLGLGPVPVLVGIHDSNASLVPHLLSRSAPFSVVSTGTWVIALAVGATDMSLDPLRDALINVSALGQPVPSARFMGGREHDLVRAGVAAKANAADANRVLARGVMLLPAVVQGSGPFPRQQMEWTEDPYSAGERVVALGWYLALMTTECLSMIGAQGPILVEGPFARNPWFVQMLATATGRTVLAAEGRTGTAPGAAMLAGDVVTVRSDAAVSPIEGLKGYASRWQDLCFRR